MYCPYTLHLAYRRRVRRTLACRTRQPSDRWCSADHDRRGSPIAQRPARNFVFSRKPHVRLRARVSQKSVETPHAIGMARDAVVKANHQHATATASFVVELIKFIAQCLLVSSRIPAIEREGNDVVQMEGVWHRDEVSAFQGQNERLVSARLIDVVDETQTLEDVQSSRRIAHPIGVPTNWSLARGLFDALNPIRYEAPLGIRTEGVAILPGAPVRGGLVPAFDDLTCEIGRFVDGLPNHERGELDLVLVEEIENAGNPLIDAVFEESVRREIRQALSDGVGNYAPCAGNRLSSGLEHQ